jgi:hypothetical protein
MAKEPIPTPQPDVVQPPTPSSGGANGDVELTRFCGHP